MDATLRTGRAQDAGAVTVPVDTGSYLRRQSSRAVRKSKKQRGWLRRSLLLLGLIATTAATAALAYQIYEFLFYSPRFELRQIVFLGNRFANVESLKRSVEQNFPRNLAQIDLGLLRQALESDVWIQQAQIRRVLPDTLRVDLVEREAVALAGIGNSIHIVDSEGTILDRYTAKYGKFDSPLVKGLEPPDNEGAKESNRRRMQLFLAANRDLDSGGEAYSRLLSEIDLTDAQNVVVVPLEDTVRIHLGDRDFRKRWLIHQEKLKLYQEMKERYGAIDSIDLRYEKQIVYQPLRGGEATADETQNRRPGAVATKGGGLR